MFSNILILTLTIFFTYCLAESQRPIVETPLGKIIGNTACFNDIPVNKFLGIPFAKPPLGIYRFKKPFPVEKWDQPLEADRLPPGCIQHSSNPFPWLDTLPNKTEDCLYLNIWTPANASRENHKSVLFFIHGGGFRIGSSRLDYYDGSVLAALGDVIVVTTNFRLGPMGFFYSGTEDAPGNMGLYDILESLKWIHSNIEHFGGNKHSITLFGQSSGAIAISMFMTSPLAKDLFVRAIMDSGSATNLDAEQNDKDFNLTQAAAEEVGCSTNQTSLKNQPGAVVECLKGIDGLTLTKTVGKVSSDPQRSLYPRYGDNILPGNARRAIINGDFTGKDVLMGYNNNEGSTMITKAWKSIFGFFGHTTDRISKENAENILRTNFKNFVDPDAVVRHYISNSDKHNEEEILYQVQSASGDYGRICPVIFLAEKIAEKGNKVYFYSFHHRPSTTPFAEWMGVVHFDEIPFVFGYPLRHKQNYTADELKLSRTMLEIWSSFAKSGKPSLQPWPLYSRKQHFNKVLRLEKDSDIEVKLHLKNCNFFRDYFGF